MTTFGGWLDAYQGSDQDILEVSRIWKDAKGERPKLFAVESVTTWVSDHADRTTIGMDRVRAALREAKAGYQASRGGTPPSAPADGAQPPEPPVQGARAIAEARGWVEPQEAAQDVPGELLAAGEPQQLPPDAVYATPDAGVPVELLPANLSRLLESIYRQGEETQRQLAAIREWQADQDKRIEPITRLLADLEAAENEADELEPDEVPHAEPGMVPMSAGGLWAGVRAAEPDMDALYQAGDGEASEGPPVQGVLWNPGWPPQQGGEMG